MSGVVTLGQIREAQQFSLNGVNYQAQVAAAASRHALGQFAQYQRFEVRSGDVHVLDDSAKERCELYARDGTLRTIPFNTDIWMSFAIRVPGFSEFAPGDPGTNGLWAICGQFHSTTAPGPSDYAALSPYWCQDLIGGKFTVQTRSFATSPVAFNPPPVIRYEDDAFPRDAWVDFVYKLNFDPTSGHMSIWRNGTSVYAADIPIGYDQADAGFFKYGIYRSAYAGTSVVELANFECGTADLSARVSAPLAHP